jgi:hypothetical protein
MCFHQEPHLQGQSLPKLSAHLEVFHPAHLLGKQMAVYTLLWLFQIPSSCEWGGACDSSLEPLRMTVVELDYWKKKKPGVITYTIYYHYSNLSSTSYTRLPQIWILLLLIRGQKKNPYLYNPHQTVRAVLRTIMCVNYITISGSSHQRKWRSK